MLLEIMFLKKWAGTSLVVQWLKLCLPKQSAWVPSLIGELRSHMPPGQQTATGSRSNIVTNLIKT